MHQNHCPYQVWIRDPPNIYAVGAYEVHYGRHVLARFVRRELAVAYRDWFLSRRTTFLTDTRLGRYTLEELLSARVFKLPRR